MEKVEDQFVTTSHLGRSADIWRKVAKKVARKLPKNFQNFLVFKKSFFLKHHGDLWSRRKVLSSQKVLLWIFLEIRYLIWRYAELNRLLVGSGLIPLNIELQQGNRTVCYGHTDVVYCPSRNHAGVSATGRTWQNIKIAAFWCVFLTKIKVDPEIWWKKNSLINSSENRKFSRTIKINNTTYWF